MSIEAAEGLKTQFTDKYVVVAKGVPELRRFADRTGRVKTVNMSGRALVEFLGLEDIGWYDIDPAYLTVVPAPAPGKTAGQDKAAHAPAKEATATKPSAKPPGEKKAGLSPLEMARQQGAAGKQGAAKAAGVSGSSAPTAAKTDAPKSEPAAAGGKKLSPLELARQQGAAKSGGGASAATAPAPTKPAPSAKPAAAPAKEETAAVEAKATKVTPAAAPAPAQKKASSGGSLPESGPARSQAILALARQQGAYTG